MPGVECILGFRGAGKSTLARTLCARDTRLVVCDTTAEYTRVLKWVPEAEADQLRADVVSGMPLRAGFVPATIEEVHWLERLVASQCNITLLCDEIDVWYQGSTGALGEGLSWIAKTGRHYNQRVVAIARLASRMPIELRSEGCLWVFPVRHQGTRRLVVDCTEMGYDPIALRVLESSGDRIYRTEVARIQGARCQVLHFDTRTGKLYQPRPGPANESEVPHVEADASDDGNPANLDDGGAAPDGGGGLPPDAGANPAD